MITFHNSPVQIGDFNILADSASISLQTPARGLTRFGSPGYYSQVRDGPAVGNVSVSYYMSDGDTGVRNLFTGDGVQLFDISVGPYQCYSGVANSMSMNIEPHSVISCTLDMSFYNGYDQDGSIGSIDRPSSGIAHGAASEASTDLLWGTDIVSVNYRMDQSISPVYALGELVPSGYTRDGGTIEVDLQGTGWGHIVDTSLCELPPECFNDTFYDATDWGLPTPTATHYILDTLEALCNTCWTTGDTVTITWPAAAGSPWSGGISAEVKTQDQLGGGCVTHFQWPKAATDDPTSVEAYPVFIQSTNYTVPRGYVTGSITLDTFCSPCPTGVQYDAGNWALSENPDATLSVSGWLARKPYQGTPPGPLPSWGESGCPPCWKVGDAVLLSWPTGAFAEDESACFEWPHCNAYATIYEKSTDEDGNCTLGFEWGTSPEPPSDVWAMRAQNLVLGANPWPHTIPFSGYVVNPSVALEPNSEIVGSLTVFDVF